MPCLLKRPAPQSPGVITFTHNEFLYGVIARSAKVRDAIRNAAASGRWIFGIHVQGDCSYLSRWPIEDWQSFVMWPDRDAGFLRGVPEHQVVPLNCVSFLPDSERVVPKSGRRWDLCVVSRASEIKRISETLNIVKRVLDRYPSLRVNFIVPDPRVLQHGKRTYAADGIERAYFELPKRIFSATELRQVSFLSPSTEAFGKFPIAHDVVANVVAQSKFLFLWSHAEGTPRAIGEALLAGTPCIVSARLRSGMARGLAGQPTVVLDDNDPSGDADAIVSALMRHDEYDVDAAAARDAFADAVNRPRLLAALSQLLTRQGYGVGGEWYLEDLPLRLCGHGRKWDLQFMYHSALFFQWFERVESADPYDEDHVCGDEGPVDRRPFEELQRTIDKARQAIRRTRVVAGTTRRRLLAFVRS